MSANSPMPVSDNTAPARPRSSPPCRHAISGARAPIVPDGIPSSPAPRRPVRADDRACDRARRARAPHRSWGPRDRAPCEAWSSSRRRWVRGTPSRCRSAHRSSSRSTAVTAPNRFESPRTSIAAEVPCASDIATAYPVDRDYAADMTVLRIGALPDTLVAPVLVVAFDGWVDAARRLQRRRGASRRRRRPRRDLRRRRAVRLPVAPPDPRHHRRHAAPAPMAVAARSTTGRSAGATC